MRLSIPLCAFIAASSAFCAEPNFQDINITYKRSTSDLDVAAQKISASDSAALFNNVPGFSLYNAGGISSMPVIRGLNDDRIKIEIEGMPLTSSCPNHMNTPTSYIDPKKVSTIELIAGITPVSMGGDSIAGTITVDSAKPKFTDGGYAAGGELAGYWRSANIAQDGYLSMYGANENAHIGYKGSYEQAGNYKNGSNQSVLDTLYAQRNQSGYVGFKEGAHYFKAEVGNQIVPYEGYVNQYMDLTGDNATFANAQYTGLFGSTGVDAKGFWKMATHQMNFLWGQKQSYAAQANNPAGMPMDTQSTEFGGSLKLVSALSDAHSLDYGADLHNYYLNDWWPPAVNPPGMMSMAGMNPNTYQNINNGHRNRIGAYVESNYAWTDSVKSLFGVRYDNVSMNTGAVAGYNNGSASGMMYTNAANDPTDAAWFNAQNRSKVFNNFDLTALGKIAAASYSDIDFGYARKNRAPNIYELYSWAGQSPTTQSKALANPVMMDMRMIGWFGDGNGYAGNLSLKAETANILSATFAFHDEAQKDWLVKVTPYYNYVQNYIDVNQIGKTAQTATAPAINYLQFANHDAVLFGADAVGKYNLSKSNDFGDFALNATLSYVRGYRTDGYNLYHMMPLNATVSLEQKYGSLQSAIDIQGVGTKNATESLRLEQTTPGYALVNFRTSYEWSKYIRIDFAITNLFNKFYWQPLGGVNIAARNVQTPTANTFSSVSAEGRSFNTGLIVKF